MTIIKVNHFNDFELKHMLDGHILELLVDTKTKKVYHVNPYEGHLKAVREYSLKILGKRVSELDKERIDKLVSVYIDIKDGVVRTGRVGRSGFENFFHMKHSDDAEKDAIKIIKKLINLSRDLKEVEVAKDMELIPIP